jgi:hypothetical protein
MSKVSSSLGPPPEESPAVEGSPVGMSGLGVRVGGSALSSYTKSLRRRKFTYRWEIDTSNAMTHRRQEQGVREEVTPNSNKQRVLEVRQENAAPTNTNGMGNSATPAGTGTTMVDISKLPANAMLLVQQLLAAIAEKSTPEGKQAGDVEMKPKENTHSSRSRCTGVISAG